MYLCRINNAGFRNGTSVPHGANSVTAATGGLASPLPPLRQRSGRRFFFGEDLRLITGG
jgi:hypothetical protein